MKEIELLEVNYPTREGHVYPRSVVNRIISQINGMKTAGAKLPVVSEQDDTTTRVNPDKIVGYLSHAELRDDKLIVHFEESLIESLMLTNTEYEWKLNGYCLWSDHLKELPNVIGYNGPKLYEIRENYYVVCAIRKAKPVKLFNSFYYVKS